MSDRYYRYRCLVCNAPFDYVNDLDEHVDKQHNPEQVLAAIKADWDNLGACRSCGWHSAWYEVEDSVREQLENQADPVELVCGSVDGLDHRDIIISVKDLGKVAAKPEHLPWERTEENKYDGLPRASILQGRADYARRTAPAPVDQPDELELAIIDWQNKYLVRVNKKGHAQEALTDLVALIAREREAGYAEGLRHGKFLEKNRHILHLRYMLDGYPSDAPEYTYVKSLFEREIAALTKGEETSQ